MMVVIYWQWFLSKCIACLVLQAGVVDEEPLPKVHKLKAMLALTAAAATKGIVKSVAMFALQRKLGR